MGIFYWVLLLVTILYGGLTVFAGIAGFKQKRVSVLSNCIMIIGGLFIIAIPIKESIFGYFSIYILIVGLLLIHISAIWNGFKMHGKINISHHLIRICISVIIIISFLLS